MKPVQPKSILSFALAIACMLLASSSANAQQATRHWLVRGDMPPGLAADYARLGNPALETHVQPVRIIVPREARIEVPSNDGFVLTNSSRTSVGMRIGPVYRFKITDIPRFAGKELYPSVEILNRLNPPTGLENEFPIEIVLTDSDFQHAIEGQLVTKVIYLENPNGPLPHRHLENTQPSFDIGGGEDPLRVAETLGRPMAILRIGSRVPVSEDASEIFGFNSPAPSLLPEPQTIRSTPGWEAIETTPQPTNDKGARLIPNVPAVDHATRQASYQNPEGVIFAPAGEFTSRDLNGPVQAFSSPAPLSIPSSSIANTRPGTKSKLSTPGFNRWNKNAGKDEYVFDGDDQGRRAQVDANWKISGLEIEDTVGHFDTVDGRRLVVPSNRVAIYAPRFGAVRKLSGVFNAQRSLPTAAFEENTPIALAAGNNQSATTKQHLAVNRHKASIRANGFVDQTRGVAAGAVVELRGLRDGFKAFENLSLLKTGKFVDSESARLELGLQSAAVWGNDLGVQIANKKIAPIIVNDVAAVEALVKVESEDGNAILRLTKVASKIAARAGEIVDFTLRFDNVSGKRIGNVTIVDNLTRRLEYVADSAECSLKAKFINSRNEADSLLLRWEITDSIAPNSGGIIRFKCRVR